MSENNDFRHEEQGYNNPENLYHFNYNEQQNTPGDPGWAEAPAAAKKPSFWQKAGVKVTALLLACAVVGGAAGYGGAALSSSGKTTIRQSNRTASEITVKQVSGQTLMSPAEVYASTVNSVVSINCSSVSTNIFGQSVQSASSGSGFIITQDGYIVTNHHVVSGASSVTVTLHDGREYPATVVGSDSDYDVAVLKINATDLQPVTLGNSSSVNVGDSVLAIGNPLGELTFSMSQGIVSCCDRAINVDGTPFNMIQVDASINPGNSGGPLMNLYGEVVGIVSAKYSSYSDTTVEGLGFAIPIGDVQAIITDIMENGQVTDKPSFGITAGTMTEQMAAQYQIEQKSGAFVYSVNKGGAGEKAGLRMGDVITKVDSTDIASMEDLTAAKKGHKAGDTVTVTYFRDGSSHTTSLTFDVKADDTVQDSQQGQQNQQNQQDQQNGGNSFGSLYDYFFGRG
ncbi:trypsin-like peptidase domain-containing protein [Vescimonas sp.]|uniref:S1C family serine protease n=1 Tax=Vescimonas sp. TaxID=2892404 RepID=UPI00307C3917